MTTFEVRYQFAAKSNPRLRAGSLVVEAETSAAAREAAIARLRDFGYSYFRVSGLVERPGDGGQAHVFT